MSQRLREIQDAYARDNARATEAVTADDLPQSFESITDTWLTAVLCAAAPGAAVLHHRLGAADNGSSNRRKIQIYYNDAGIAAGLPHAVFCKASQDLANRIVLGLSGGARGEVLFYNQFRPLLTIEAPMSYYAHADPQTYNSMIMLGDLSADVLAFCDHTTAMDKARAESQMRLLGQLHGACYGNPVLRARLAGFGTWLEFFNNTRNFGMQDGSNAGFLAAEDVIPPRLYRRFADIWPAAVAAVESADGLPPTLAHGDVHLKNWYIAGNGEMGLSDWQCATSGHWGRDVAYAISSALTVEHRRAWERDLLAYYLAQLANAGGPAVTFDDAWAIYRRQLNPALTWWTVTLAPPPDIPDMQPKDVTRAFIHRIATAMDDLDALDA